MDTTDQLQDKPFTTGSGDVTGTQILCHQSNRQVGNSGRMAHSYEGGSGAFVGSGSSNIHTRMMAGTGNGHGGIGQYLNQRPVRACTSPISSIVGTALNQLNLKRSSSAPMINQLGTANDSLASTINKSGLEGGGSTASVPRLVSTTVVNVGSGSVNRLNSKETTDTDASALASSFLASFNNSGPRPRRFSASFSPGSPTPAPNRVHQLRQENTTDWETVSEKEFHGTSNIAQSWEDLSLESMSMEVASRRPSLSDQLWLTMPPTSSASASASSSPAASPRVLSRFSPSLSSPSPTRKSFTTRRSLSPIAVRPSVLSIGQGVKRKVDWDSGLSPMDCSPQPAKRAGGLLSFQSSNYSYPISNQHAAYNSTSPFHLSSSSGSTLSMITNHVEDSPNSFETESSVSSNGGVDSPFFRPVDSPITVLATPEDSPHPSLPKI